MDSLMSTLLTELFYQTGLSDLSLGNLIMAFSGMPTREWKNSSFLPSFFWA